MNALANRPTETITGLGAGLAVYGFATQVGLGQPWSAIVAVVVVVVPFLVSAIVDILRPHRAATSSDTMLSADVIRKIAGQK